jgi:hypothetical protein
MLHWDVNGHGVSLSYKNAVKHMLGQDAVALLHLVFKKSVETILASRHIVSEFRVGVLPVQMVSERQFYLLQDSIRFFSHSQVCKLCIKLIDGV